MDLTALDISRIQFAFVITFHIIFPSFTIGLAAWLTLLEWRYQRTSDIKYRQMFDFWIKIFAVSFGMGVVSGIVMAFQFGTNWSVLSEKTGSIQGPLLGYESFTAFILEASFLGVVLFGREKTTPRMYLISCFLVALGTTFSSFWIMANNSWMQVPVGYAIDSAGKIIPTDWKLIIGGHVFITRWLHMLLGAYITTATVVAAVGSYYVLKNKSKELGKSMIHWGCGLLLAVLPLQIVAGHLAGLIIEQYQPAKFAAVEGRWESEKEAPLVLFAIPDFAEERNKVQIEIPKIGSIADSGSVESYEKGIKDIPLDERAPFYVPFYGFRIMVGIALILLTLGGWGTYLSVKGKLESSKNFLRFGALCFPLGWVAVIAGWYLAEVGRQPWVVYGLLKTSDAVTPSLTVTHAAISLATYVVVYIVVFGFGFKYLYRLIKQGPQIKESGDK